MAKNGKEYYLVRWRHVLVLVKVRVEIFAGGIVHLEAQFAGIFLGGAAACLTADRAMVVGIAVIAV